MKTIKKLDEYNLPKIVSLRLCKFIGKVWETYCPDCGTRMVAKGYDEDDKEKCPMPECIKKKAKERDRQIAAIRKDLK